MEKRKTCIKCGEVRPLDSFYKHPQMADGHLNECKECKKAYQRDFCRSEKGRAYDRIRLKTKKRKQWLIEYQKKKRKENPLKTKCYVAFMRGVRNGTLKNPNVCSKCGNTHEKIQGHHPDYKKPFEVVWLCPECHRKQHKQYERKY